MMNNIDIQSYIPGIAFPDSRNFFLIAGPCVVEGRDITMQIAEHILSLSERYRIPFIFKASYRKANRSRLDSFSGIGDIKALSILREVKEKLGVPVISDIHSADEAMMAAEYCDVLQIPAFLCRQTDILVASARTGRAVSIKKGQFLSPGAMKFAVDKVMESGNSKVLVTERGSMFGYQDLVVDFRGIPEMKAFGVPVVLDVTHSLQQPNQESGVTGGRPDQISSLAIAGIAVGADGIFLETHPRPGEALSDGANMLPLDQLEDLLKKLIKIREVVVSLGNN